MRYDIDRSSTPWTSDLSQRHFVCQFERSEFHDWDVQESPRARKNRQGQRLDEGSDSVRDEVDAGLNPPHNVGLPSQREASTYKCMAKNYWIVKQEPNSYSWDTFVKEGKTAWTGVRNFAARNHLRGMRKGDAVLFYHSGAEKEVVGLARVTRAPYPDPTASEGDWVAVELSPVRPLRKPVGLPTMKSDPTLREMPLIRQSRLSVAPLTEEQYRRLLELGETRG